MIRLNQESRQLDVRVDEPYFEGPSIMKFRNELRELPKAGVESVAVDLQKVNQMDSSGLSALLDLKRHFDELTAVSFSLENVKPAVGNVITLLGAAEFLNFQVSN